MICFVKKVQNAQSWDRNSPLIQTLKKWRANIDFNEDFLVSKQLNTKFAPKYRISNYEMPVNIKFNSKYVFRPPNTIQEGKNFHVNLGQGNYWNQ